MSVPPPPAPRKFVSKFPPAQSPTAPAPAPQPAVQKPPAFVPPSASSSSSPAPPPAGWTTSKASEVASPTSSIMKKKSPALGPSPANPLSFAPASLASSIASNGGSLSPTAQSEQLLKQQLMIEELVRENRNLQGRVARWLQSSEGELADDAERQRAAGQARRKSAAAAATHLHRTKGQDAGDSEEPPLVAGTPNAASASSALGGAAGYETVAVGALTEVLDEKSKKKIRLEFTQEVASHEGVLSSILSWIPDLSETISNFVKVEMFEDMLLPNLDDYALPHIEERRDKSTRASEDDRILVEAITSGAAMRGSMHIKQSTRVDRRSEDTSLLTGSVVLTCSRCLRDLFLVSACVSKEMLSVKCCVVGTARRRFGHQRDVVSDVD
ncbi:Hypothetical protein, putative [Bodo saltans]|uniref:Uncharacterized protein n=1 Tax=Bodo saltans TaxID=75058 RepID=A0A0S4J9Y0_BODSA|nr:Hypothetical protein, putative [Bodo saltans]|eukprot:CUG86910.1 Hypothetical protein, putative [Bodo saltans]